MDLTRIYLDESNNKRNYHSKYFNQNVSVNFKDNRIVSYFLYKDWKLLHNDDYPYKSNEIVRAPERIPPCKFATVERAFNKKDEDYWLQFGVPTDVLTKFGVNAISKLIYHKDHSDTIITNDYMYQMNINNKELIKIYSPYDKEMKWLSYGRTKNLCLFNYANPNHKTCCICSGMKDALSLYCQMNKYIDVFFLNSETALLSTEQDAWLFNNYEYIYVCYDNDKTGLTQAENFCSFYGYRNIVIPKIEGVKDIAEFYQYDENKSINFFRKKIII